jgi:hypothetical protein
LVRPAWALYLEPTHPVVTISTIRRQAEEVNMCRNIKRLYNLEPPATRDEMQEAALQFVRKISGFAKPSAANQAVFKRAVDEVAASSAKLLNALVTTAPSRNREADAAKARARARATEP